MLSAALRADTKDTRLVDSGIDVCRDAINGSDLSTRDRSTHQCVRLNAITIPPGTPGSRIQLRRFSFEIRQRLLDSRVTFGPETRDYFRPMGARWSRSKNEGIWSDRAEAIGRRSRSARHSSRTRWKANQKARLRYTLQYARAADSSRPRTFRFRGHRPGQPKFGSGVD